VPRVLLIDNYDSFTFNLVQALRALGAAVDVVRNDAITVAEARERDPTHVVVSPGPGRPEDAGVSMPVITAFLGRRPILGVCLGHQALGAVLGARVTRASRPVHGKPSAIHHDGRTVYAGLPDPFEAGRYHSLIVEDLPPVLEISSWTDDGETMGIRHRTLPAEGVQFHPESILTPDGQRLLANFLGM
jgi:anthranilate synthase/aminodeoxychorismate synthase-like glutamine amidotransferase